MRQLSEMAANDGDKKGGGLLGWIRTAKQAEHSGPTPAIKVVLDGPHLGDKTAAPLPSEHSGAAVRGGLPREVSLRHIDKGEIAKGGMGSVRKVFDTNLQRTVAMKVLFPEHRHDPKVNGRFAEEAQILGQLQHPNIVPVHDFGEDEEGTRYFTMYYVRGKTLTDILHSETVADGSREAYFKLLNIFLRMCDAVAFAHSRGVVHRDLKPDNVMVGAFGEVYLMDWGIAKLLGRPAGGAVGGEVDELVRVRSEHADDETGQIIGTFFYMSPEQANAQIEDIDERTDVFQLGGVLYELVTGQTPYVGSTVVEVVRQAQKAVIPPPQLVSPERHIPPALERICMKALQKKREDRYQSVLELKADIEQFLKGGASFPVMSFAAGEHLMQEGDRGDQVFIVTKGLVQVYKTFADGRRKGLATLGPGAVVGEAAVLSGEERTASVVAVEDTLVTAVTRAQLDRELGLNNWMGPLVRALADRFVDVDKQLSEARSELSLARIESWAFQYLMSHGQPGENGAREVLLTPMLKQGKRVFLKPEPELRRTLESSKALSIDAARDVIAFVPAS